ncbi:MAG: glycosyltransferase family 4 protein [Thermodesulfobacteriota bacterium]
MGQEKKRSNIIFIHHGAVPGGAPTSLRNLTIGLACYERLQLTVCCPFPAMIAFFAQVPGVRVIRYPRPCKVSGKVAIGWANLFRPMTFCQFVLDMLYAPVAIVREARFLRQLRPDIVHLNSSILWTSAIAAKLNRCLLVWHVRETFLGGKGNLRRKLYARFIAALADRVVCISPSEAASMDALHSAKHEIIYNSIDFSAFQPAGYDQQEEKKIIGFRATDFVILSLGGTSFRKGAFQLIDCLHYLEESVKVVIAGEWTVTRPAALNSPAGILLRVEDVLVKWGWKKFLSWLYPRRLANLFHGNVRSRVLFPGGVDQLPGLIAACDVLVFAGTTPHFARPIYEAWAMEKPVIVFDTPVMRSEVEDGVDGLLVAEHTGKALAAGIEQLRKNPAMGQAFGQKGRKKAMERFDLHQNAERIACMYFSLLGKK